MKKNEKLTGLLPKETAAEFEVIGLEGYSKAQNFGKFGTVDFSTLSLQKAAAISKRGFKYLKRKNEASAKKK